VLASRAQILGKYFAFPDTRGLVPRFSWAGMELVTGPGSRSDGSLVTMAWKAKMSLDGPGGMPWSGLF
jgi:hypothetical protein